MINNIILHKHLSQYDLGEIIEIQPLIGGTVNTHYLINSTQGQWVWTILEAMPYALAQELSRFLLFLNAQEYPTPIVHPSRSGEALCLFEEKPSLLVTYLKGNSPIDPSPKACYQIGRALAQLHVLSQRYAHAIPNTMNNAWRLRTAELYMPTLNKTDQEMIQNILNIQNNLNYDQLPHGIVHFDLFRDNSLFINEKLTGIIDFYYACYDSLLMDFSICLHDWCTDWQDAERKPIEANITALRRGYESIRPLNPLETKTLPSMLKISALHFWLARMQSGKKDPEDYKQILWHYCE